METPPVNRQVLKKELLHRGRNQLIKELKRCDSSLLLTISSHTTKKELIRRIMKALKKQETAKSRKKKKRTTNDNSRVYDSYSSEGSKSNRNKYKQNIDTSHTVLPPRKKKLKPKPKHKKYENMMKFVFVIENMNERPFLNGKQCKIVSAINKKKEYRVCLINNDSQHLIAKANLRKIGTEHRRKKTVHIGRESKHKYNKTNPEIEGFSIEDKQETNGTNHITASKIINSDIIDPIEIYAIGVFVNYQMILKLFINKEIEHLFGTKYKSFKSLCFSFLEEIYGERSEHFPNNKHIEDSSYALHYHKSNDKQIVFLTKQMYKTMDLSVMKCINSTISCACDKYKEIPSEYDIMHEVFRLHDEYGFGEINKKEFNKFLRALAHKTKITRSSSSTLFDRIDKDGIKAITFNQFVQYMMKKKKVLWELLLELAQDYELEYDSALYLQQVTLSKIHKVILMMHESYQMRQELCLNDVYVWENNMFEYMQFVENNQYVIDEKVHSKCKKIKYFEKSSYFIHNNKPDIE